MEEENCRVSDNVVSIEQSAENSSIYAKDAPTEILFEIGQGDTSSRVGIGVDLPNEIKYENDQKELPGDRVIVDSMQRLVSADSECDAILDAVNTFSVDARQTNSSSSSDSGIHRTSASSESPSTSGTSLFTDGKNSKSSNPIDMTYQNELSESPVADYYPDSEPLTNSYGIQTAITSEQQVEILSKSPFNEVKEILMSASSENNVQNVAQSTELSEGCEIQIPSIPTSHAFIVDLEDTNQIQQSQLQINDTPAIPRLVSKSKCNNCTYHNPPDVNDCLMCGSWELEIVQVDLNTYIESTVLPQSHTPAQLPKEVTLQILNFDYPVLPSNTSDFPADSSEYEEGACALPLPQLYRYCVRCTYRNSEDAKRCEMCNTQMGSLPSALPTGSSKYEDGACALPLVQSYRDCVYCTYRNRVDSEYCEVCNLKTGSFSSGSKYRLRLEEEQDYYSSAAQGRICNRCTYINEPKDNICSVCRYKLECQPLYSGGEEPKPNDAD